MTISLDAFVAKYDGKRIDSPGGIGGQCVDLANEYALECFGYPHEWRNAIDWFGFDPAHYEWVRNNPRDLNQIPPRGALMVWGPSSQVGTGSLGHIDLVVSAGPQSFVGFDQNWPVGAYAHHVAHSYAGVIGWGIPKALLNAAPAPAPVPAPVPSTPTPPPLSAPVPPLTPAPPSAPPAGDRPINPPIVSPAPLPQGGSTPVASNAPDEPSIDIPEPQPVAEAGVTTSEWKVLIGYAVQLAGVGTATLVGDLGGSLPPASLQVIGGFEVLGLVLAVSWIVSRAIRKIGTTA